MAVKHRSSRLAILAQGLEPLIPVDATSAQVPMRSSPSTTRGAIQDCPAQDGRGLGRVGFERSRIVEEEESERRLA